MESICFFVIFDPIKMLLSMERIYHYTSVDAFDKMLREMKRHGSKELLFWASNIHYMNDPNEMSFLYDKLGIVAN